MIKIITAARAASPGASIFLLLSFITPSLQWSLQNTRSNHFHHLSCPHFTATLVSALAPPESTCYVASRVIFFKYLTSCQPLFTILQWSSLKHLVKSSKPFLIWSYLNPSLISCHLPPYMWNYSTHTGIFPFHKASLLLFHGLCTDYSICLKCAHFSYLHMGGSFSSPRSYLNLTSLETSTVTIVSKAVTSL